MPSTGSIISRLCALAFAATSFWAGSANAGPVIVSATDIDDHGSATASANQEGWLFLQRALESVAANVKNSQKVVVCLGCNGQVATSAFNSAFDKSSLPDAGWTRKTVATSVELSGFFTTTLAAGIQTIFATGIVYMPSDRINAQGGLTEAQLDLINANASALSQHVASGGGLITLLQSGLPAGYGWLKSQIPGLTVETTGLNPDATLEPTALLLADFPNLPVSALGAASHAHAHFKGALGGLRPLAMGAAGTGTIPNGEEPKSNHNLPVLIGGANANFTDPAAHGVPVDHPLALAFIAALVAFVTRKPLARALQS
jgi:hypothetical protein